MKTTPEVAIIHNNVRGTGSTFKLSMTSADINGAGCVEISISHQTGGDGHQVRLGLVDVCKLLQVFRGECESVDDGRGIIAKDGESFVRVCLDHKFDPIPCYHLTITNADDTASFNFTSAESYGIVALLERGVSFISLGL